MTTKTETLRFQAEAQEVLGLMIHSLYKHEEIFLRELVSNASDAIDKRRFEALTKPELAAGGEPEIRIEVDRGARTLSVEDDGIGMDRQELVEHLGTIARSGTKLFLERLKAERAAANDLPQLPHLIGQFGVGFYSSFIVADEVTVETRRAGTDEGWRWRSRGEGEYTVEPAVVARPGTRVTLHLRERTEDDEVEHQDFLDRDVIRGVVRRYSDFVAYPIRMRPEDGGEPETLNSRKPLWARPKDEITTEEHAEFYRHLTHDWEQPLEAIHFRAEGTTEYTALLYVPSHRPLDLFDPGQVRSQLALYVKRVLILPDCPDLLPSWLRFVRGLVDSADLPLNVSREVLQANPIVRQIRKRLEKRVVEALAGLLERDAGRYARFWSQFGVLIKEGIYAGDDVDGRLSKIALFATTHGPEPTTLASYVGRMKPDQKTIYYLAGPERAALEGSPHLEAFAKRGLEVLLMTDPVDEWVLQRLREFDGKPLAAVDRGEHELASESEKQAREDKEREHRDLLAAIERRLGADVKEVRISTRLAESPAALVNDAHGLSPHMERILRAANQEVPPQKRILELNADHPLFAKLAEVHARGEASEEFGEAVELLHGQALLAEGSPLPNPARFAKLVAKRLAR